MQFTNSVNRTFVVHYDSGLKTINMIWHVLDLRELSFCFIFYKKKRKEYDLLIFG